MFKSINCLVCVSVVLFWFVPFSRADVTPPRTVSTTGDAVIYVTPDKAVISVGIDTFDAKLGDTEKANTSQGKVLVDAIEKLGIDPKQIGTSDVSISIVYPDSSSHRQTDIQGYRCIREYAVTVTDTKLVQKVIDAATANGANILSGVQYEDSQARKHRDDARKQAATAAKEKANDLATALDCRVIRTLTIRENTAPASMYLGNNFAQSVSSEPDKTGNGEDSLPPGQIAMRASVSVEFEIADAPAK